MVTDDCIAVTKPSPNEFLLAKYLYENRVATCAQIQRDVYTKSSLTSVQNRLVLLTRRKVLKRGYFEGVGNKFVYSLGDAGFRNYIRELGGTGIKNTGSYAIVHDLALLEIRRLLQKNKNVTKYFPEVLLSNSLDLPIDGIHLGGINPDAVLQVEIDSRIFLLTLEYESSCKFQQRYIEIFRKYYACRSIPGVLYICKNESMLSHIRAIESSVVLDETPKIYYSDFSKWSESNIKMFTSLKGSCIKL